MGESPIIKPPSKGRQSCRPASKKPLKRGSSATQCGGWFNPAIIGFTSEERPYCSIPHQSWGRIIRLNPNQGQSTLQQQKDPHVAGLLENWYRGGDSNPYSLWPLPPQGSVSTNSTTSAKSFVAHCLLLLWGLRYIRRINSRLSGFQNWYIFNSRSGLLHFQDCRIRQTNLSQTFSFIFSYVS